MAEARRANVENAQILRFVAAGLVLVGHTLHQSAEMGRPLAAHAAAPWGMGVDIFFVISGFVMAYTAGDAFGRPGAARAFLVRRLQRIAPLYWVFTTLALAAVLLIGGLLTHNQIDLPYVLASYGFVPWPRAEGDVKPLLALGWTLNYEMFFYGLFALALMLPRRWGALSLVAVLLCLAALNPIIPDRWFVLAYWSNPIILEFLAGLGVGWLYRRGVRLPLLLAAPAVVLGFLAAQVEAGDGARWYAWGLPATVITAAVVLTRPAPEHAVTRLFSLLGAASYALYLSHPFVMNIIAVAWTKVGLDAPWLFVVVTCLAAVATSVAVLWLVERPIAALFRRHAALKTAPAAA